MGGNRRGRRMSYGNTLPVTFLKAGEGLGCTETHKTFQSLHSWKGKRHRRGETLTGQFASSLGHLLKHS